MGAMLFSMQETSKQQPTGLWLVKKYHRAIGSKQQLNVGELHVNTEKYKITGGWTSCKNNMLAILI